MSAATIQAKCSHCGKPAARRNLRPAPEGGAICKDWFACQRRFDEARAAIIDRRPRSSRAAS